MFQQNTFYCEVKFLETDMKIHQPYTHRLALVQSFIPQVKLQYLGHPYKFLTPKIQCQLKQIIELYQHGVS